MEENLNVLDFTLTTDEMAAIAASMNTTAALSISGIPSS